MRNRLTAAALVVFVVSSGLLEMIGPHKRLPLPTATGMFAPVDASAVTSAMR